MSMKRVKEAPIRHFYENIIYGEDLTSLLVVNQQLGGKMFASYSAGCALPHPS